MIAYVAGSSALEVLIGGVVLGALVVGIIVAAVVLGVHLGRRR